MKTYIKKQVAAATGLSPRTIQFYTETGLVTPGIEDAKGKGGNRKYSRMNVAEFLVIKELAERGVHLTIIKQIIHHLSEAFRRKRDWLMLRLQKKKSPEYARAIIFNPCTPDMAVVEFSTGLSNAGHLYDADGTALTLEHYLQRAESGMVAIIDLSSIIEKITESVPD